MQDLLQALFEAIFIGSLEGVFSRSRSRLGCALSIGALGVVLLTIVAFGVAFVFQHATWANWLAGLACLFGSIEFVALGMGAALVKARHRT